MDFIRPLGRFLMLATVFSAASAALAADTLSLDEAKTAASAKFDKLDTKGTGKLEPEAVKSLLGEKGFKAADTDDDGTLDRKEWLALTEKLFKRADVEHDGSVDSKELNGPNGKMLKRLIR